MSLPSEGGQGGGGGQGGLMCHAPARSLVPAAACRGNITQMDVEVDASHLARRGLTREQVGWLGEQDLDRALLLGSKGRLQPYLPVVDSRRVDRAYAWDGIGQPWFVQVKGTGAPRSDGRYSWSTPPRTSRLTSGSSSSPASSTLPAVGSETQSGVSRRASSCGSRATGTTLRRVQYWRSRPHPRVGTR